MVFESSDAIGKVFSPEELETMAKERLNEDPKRREADIKSIQDWLSKQPHLKDNCRKDENFILMYLRGCKFSLEKTKQKLDTWHTVRTLTPDMFEGFDYNKDKKLKELIKLGINVPLRGFDKNGRRVIIMRGSRADPDKYSMLDQFRASFMINELLMKDCDDYQGQVCGVVIVQDTAGSKLAHATNFSPSVGKKAMTIFQEAYPSNPKAMHFLGLPGFMENIMNVMSAFLKDKIKQRMQFHAKDDFSKLIEDLGPEVLPVEYGGTNGSIQEHVDALVKEVEANSSWIAKQYKHKSVEKKRPGKEKLYSDIFGMEGSFRQLTVD